ncbi:MAG: hypothetical protein QNJ14_08065 [Woeseiaceae bacterium]|nr:hypothetical protein [Woeseiaceae bacterium]
MAEAAGIHEGRCHCGAIGYRYRCAAPPVEWAIRACQCRFCRVHNALSTSDPTGTIAFEATEPAQLQRYRFGLRTADFLLCRRCGVYIGAIIETPKGSFGIINTHALVDPQPNMALREPISYDGEDTRARVARREQRWSRVTGFPE